MEKVEIRDRVVLMQSKNDFLQLLNELISDDLTGEDTFTFSIRQLSYLSNPNNVIGRYKHFFIKKKSGGHRKISAPQRNLACILHYVNIILKSLYHPSDYAMGFTEGRSVVDNASRHIGQNYVFNTDIENFFPSIEEPRVWARLQLPPFSFSKEIAGLIAGLCCIRETQEDGNFKYVLPQGAPTSPLLTNAICDKLDHRLSGLARRFGLHFSRYADDITFSSMHNVYQENGEFMKELKKIIEGQNFYINAKKTRVQKVGQRQEVTGLVVSSRVNTSQEYVAEIRNLLHIWEKYGYNEAYKRFYTHYKKTKGHVKKGEPVLENVLFGKLQYLRMVKGSKDSVYMSLKNRYDKLTGPLNMNSKGMDYLRSFTVEEFENIVGSKISYCLSQKNNVYGKVTVAGSEVIIGLDDAAKYKLVTDKIITDDAIISKVKPVKEKIAINSKTGLYVVLVSRNASKPFWLMMTFEPTGTNVNICNMPAHDILDVWEKQGIDAAIKFVDSFERSDRQIPSDNLSNDHLTDLRKQKSMNRGIVLLDPIIIL